MSEPSEDYKRLLAKFQTISIHDSTLQDAFLDLQALIDQPEKAEQFLTWNSSVLARDAPLPFQTCLIGYALSVSSLPRHSAVSQGVEFFQVPLSQDQSEHSSTEKIIGLQLQYVTEQIHKLFYGLLKVPQTRNKFLNWLGRCIYSFNDRKKLWSNQLLMSSGTLSVNDGYLMNLLGVMLRLSEPFAGPYNIDTMPLNGSGYFNLNKKLLKIDSNYCKWSRIKASEDPNNVNQPHMLGLSEETMLVDGDNPTVSEPTNSNNPHQTNINFITECFFGTHQVFTYGFRSIYERFFKLAQSVNDLQQLYTETQSHPDNRARELIQQKIGLTMSQFYNLKAVLMVPSHITMLVHFSISTAAYLNHLVACTNYEEAQACTEFKTITIDMLKDGKLDRERLKHIPEMLVENIVDFMIFLKHFNEQILIRAVGIMEPIMTLIIIFMGDSSLMKNPHLRARFAEILECLIPHQSTRYMRSSISSEALFDHHPLSEHLVPSLINVFVSIEMTGEGVQFEQKFSYRRPMYVVLEHLWTKSMHQNTLKKLAEDSERNIESARQPLFLRFINLLMNDAIFLLDEALSYMNQLRETEIRRKSPEWARLDPNQRSRAEATNSHIGRLARFHNVLGLATIGTLSWLTSDIKTIFCHQTLVDRVANMLNYFLEHLVGPKKGKLNVHDKNDYEFKPKLLLEKICQIYVHLGSSGTNPKYREFCTAVSSDGRSYSENLLPQAIEILFKTGLSSIGMEFEILSKLIHEIAEQNRMDEIPVDGIPDEYLDPIMSTLMVDPVLLPSSQITVDRSTIARHLLSDQTDPFNRSPLSMEKVIPNVALKAKIDEFLKNRRKEQASKTN